MASLELDVMKSYRMACDVIKDSIINNIQNAALKSEIKLTKEDLAKISHIVRTAADAAASNSARQMQSAIASHQKK